jgi:hypothetical protein
MIDKREKDKKIKEMKAENVLEGIEGNLGDVSYKIDGDGCQYQRISRNQQQ